MPEYQFTVVISGDLDQEQTLDALFEAGCDDATFGVVDGAGYGDFCREAPSLGAAIRSAINAVESVTGLRVSRIEPDDLVTMTEIAERTDRSRESVRLLILGERGPGGFPAPVSHLRARNRLWRWSEVSAWFEKTEERQEATLIAAVNARLAWRESSERLAPSDRELVASLG